MDAIIRVLGEIKTERAKMSVKILAKSMKLQESIICQILSFV